MELKHNIHLPLDDVGELLIVPYGIETWNSAKRAELKDPFNCTLWN